MGYVEDNWGGYVEMHVQQGLERMIRQEEERRLRDSERRRGSDDSSSSGSSSESNDSQSYEVDQRRPTKKARKAKKSKAASEKGDKRRGPRSAAAASADEQHRQAVEAELHCAAPVLSKLKVVQLQGFLRSAGIRCTGRKDELIERVQRKHNLLAAGGAARSLCIQDFPESSFTLDCVGDVCKGDAVLFKQPVYGEYDVSARTAAVLGYRKVAGRVVSESYGALKQQHTFSIEVMWSSGFKACRPLELLLIKGRNLYALVKGVGVRRQPWADEAQREAALEEKHGRGATARAVRGASKGKRAQASAKRRRSDDDSEDSEDVGRQATTQKRAKRRAAPVARKGPGAAAAGQAGAGGGGGSKAVGQEPKGAGGGERAPLQVSQRVQQPLQPKVQQQQPVRQAPKCALPPGVTMCRCGAAAAKACAHSQCGGCCSGKGCVRHKAAAQRRGAAIR